MDTLGAWHLEEGCTGSIVMLRREYYWVSECDPSDPMPEKTYGFPLHQRGESWYTSEISGISFCIQEDGSLIMRSEGDPDFHADPAP